MTEIKISVIIPLYNKSKYIARALDSVLAQTFTNFEIVVIDDGSTDCGPEIVAQYNDKRIKLIKQANQGPGAARNRGMEESRGGLLAFLDADDEWMTLFLERSFNNFVKYPECDISATSYFQGPQKKDFSELFIERGINDGLWKIDTNTTVESLKYAVDFFSSCTLLCKREVLEQYSGFYTREGCSYGEDAHLFLQLLLTSTVYRDTKSLVWYHTEASELSDNGRETICPPRPILSDPSVVREGCPGDYQNLLEEYLGYYAILTMHDHLNIGDTITCAGYFKAFPRMKKWRMEYIKLKFKTMFPKLIPLCRVLKRK